MSVLILNKEKGISSFSALKKAQKELAFTKAGHAGTLDPLATGVLPIFFNDYTRLIDLISNDRKEYIADFVIGISSNTQDITGKLVYYSNSFRPISRTSMGDSTPCFLIEFVSSFSFSLSKFDLG